MNENKAIIELKEVVEEYEQALFTNLNGIIELAYNEGVKDTEQKYKMNIKCSVEDIISALSEKWSSLLDENNESEEI